MTSQLFTLLKGKNVSFCSQALSSQVFDAHLKSGFRVTASKKCSLFYYI